MKTNKVELTKITVMIYGLLLTHFLASLLRSIVCSGAKGSYSVQKSVVVQRFCLSTDDVSILSPKQMNYLPNIPNNEKLIPISYIFIMIYLITILYIKQIYSHICLRKRTDTKELNTNQTFPRLAPWANIYRQLGGQRIQLYIAK